MDVHSASMQPMRRRGSNDVRRGSLAWLSTRNSASYVATSTAVTHQSSHHQTPRHLSVERVSSVAKLRYPHISSSNMDFSDILYVHATLELDQAGALPQAAASCDAIGIMRHVANKSQSHGELRRRRLYRSWRCCEIVPLQRLVSTPVLKGFIPKAPIHRSRVQLAPPYIAPLDLETNGT